MNAADTQPEHLPVMVEEIVEVFRPVPEGVIVDATVGAGGHSAALLASRPDLSVIGLDRDEDALTMASAATARFGARVTLVHARFDTLADVVRGLGHEHVAGVLFDLGVSSMQLDRPERGFSYRGDGPIDMRMDRTEPFSAADVVNGYAFEPLAELIARYGGERFSARVARAIIAARPLATTAELAGVVRDAIPAAARRTGGHPARRTFQGIRMEVNAELAVIPRALDQALDLLVPGGRLAVLAYHSGEDRLVKQMFTTAVTGGCTCPPGLPCVCGAAPAVRLLWRGVHKPSAAEVAANRRAESARLRVAEKLQTKS
ncbi:MAG: rRNA (cytosine1402-N4)-methyltransferase [Actinomycetota bacterium]|nr:rRNA (cytosine1402-N4)-methyltransferase [Actinomycetota bacterium]